MILFALPDSLTLVAGQSSLRLESYLFTLQAVQAAKAHLNPGDGLFAMYNYYRTPWSVTGWRTPCRWPSAKPPASMTRASRSP